MPWVWKTGRDALHAVDSYFSTDEGYPKMQDFLGQHPDATPAEIIRIIHRATTAPSTPSAQPALAATDSAPIASSDDQSRKQRMDCDS